MQSATTPAESARQNLQTDFKRAMRRLASTVTIVTASGAKGPSGMTATAVTSVCANPPAVLVCINRSASIHGSLKIGSNFCVNILSEHHGDLSCAFGGKTAPGERFRVGDWSWSDDATPFLQDAQASLFCAADAIYGYGTHSVIIGKVSSVRISGDVCPLVFADGRFISAKSSS